MKSKQRNILLLISGILILGIFGVIASSINSNSIQISNNILNDSGQFFNGNQINLIYDVCRSTSASEDISLIPNCKYICLSTDTDCQQELQNTLGTNCDNKVVNWKGGNYPVIARNQISNTAFLYAGCSNFTLNAYNVRLFINYTNDNTIQRGLEIGNSLRNNVHINGIEIIGNSICYPGKICYGLRLWSCKDCSIKDTKVSNVYGFQYTVESVSSTQPSENVVYDNVQGYGIGTSDIIGGGGNDKNIYIVNSRLEQHLINGTYSNAIDLVNLTGFYVSGTTINGGLLIGSEEGNSVNVKFIGNNVYPPINFDGTLNYSTTAVFGFHPNVNVTDSIIANNIVYDTLDINDYSKNVDTIFGNSFLNQSSKQTENYNNNLNFNGNLQLNGRLTLNSTITYGTPQNMTLVYLVANNNRGLWFTNNTIFDSLDSQGIYRLTVRTGDYGAGLQVWDDNNKQTTFFANSKNGGYIQLFNNTGSPCNSFTEGSIKYNQTAHKHYGCNSTDWVSLY